MLPQRRPCRIPKKQCLVRVLGALSSASFAVLACRLIAEPKADDLWDFCHWIGQTLLGVFVGCVGLYAEVKGSLAMIRRHFRKFALNRIGLSIFYFWLGCYVMGGDIGGGDKRIWKILAHVTGFVAWTAAVLDLLVSCCSDKIDDEEEALARQAEKDLEEDRARSRARLSAQCQATSSSITFGRSGSTEGLKQAATMANPRPEDVEVQIPAGGWAGGGSKPFGSV